jgi:hypothetical protein
MKQVRGLGVCKTSPLGRNINVTYTFCYMPTFGCEEYLKLFEQCDEEDTSEGAPRRSVKHLNGGRQ